MKEKVIEKSLLGLTLLSVVFISLIVVFIVYESLPAFSKIGILEMLFSNKWAPDLELFGILPMIISTVCMTMTALLIAVPLSISCAIFIEEIAPYKLKNIFKPIIQCLSGIPSVVYGFFGLTVLVPFIRVNFGGTGFSLIAASLILAVMILPTIISLSCDAIRNVSSDYRQASLALGSTHIQTIRNIVVPCAMQGFVTAVILAMGRAIGETLAVLMVAGNVSQIPTSLLSPVRTLTSNIALEMGYAMDIHYNALFVTALVLFLIIILLMIISNYVQNKWGVGS